MGKNTIIYLISLFIVAIRNVDSLISDQRACFDEECSEYLSKAKTLINYPSNEEYILSFKANEIVKVFSKSAGNRPELWGVEINGKRGYAPKKFLRESKIVKKPSVNVLTEIYELNSNGEIVLKNVKDRGGADKRKSQDVAGNIQSTPTEALPSNDKLKPSSVTDASYMPSVDNLKVDATPTYQVIDGTTIPNDSYETSTQAVNIVKEPVQQPDYKVHEDEDETVDMEDEDEEGFDGDDEEEEEEEDEGEEAEKTEDTSTIVETSQEINKSSDLEENIIPPQTVEISKDSDVNVDGALSNNDVLDNSVNNSTNNIKAENIEENSDKDKLPIVNNLAEHRTENINPINNFLPKETISMETAEIPQNVRPIVENLDVASLKIIENISNDSVASDNINNEIIPDSVNEITIDNVLNTQIEIEVSDSKNDSIESEVLKTAGAVIADNILSVPVLENVIPESVPDSNLDKIDLNMSESVGVVESDKATIPSSAESNSADINVIKNETLNYIPADKSAIDAKIFKEMDHAVNSAVVADQGVVEQPIETGNVLPSESASEANNIIKESANANKIKPDAMNSIDEKSSQIVPNLINLNEPNIYINSGEEKKYSIDAPAEQKQEAAYVNSAYLTPISPLSQLVHRSLPDSYQYSNENETLDSETNDTQDDPNYPRHESTTAASSIEQGSIDYKSEEITTQYPPIENIYERTQEPIYDPYKQIYNSNFDSPKAEIVEETITQNDIGSNEDITEPSKILYPPEAIQEMPVDSSDENESSLNIFQGIFKSVTNLFKSSGVENEQSIDADGLNSDTSDILTKNEVELQNEMNVQREEHGHSQDFLSAIFPEAKQCNAEDRVSGSWLDISTDLVFWMVLSAVSVLMFTLGFYYLENKKQDGKLLAMVNSLQKELLCSSKENVILREDLGITKEKLFGIEDSSFGSNEMVVCLKKELTDTQLTISDLQDKLTSAEEELANSTEAALELQSILDEQLNSKDTSSSSLTFTVTNLQSQLDDQQTTMNMTKAQLAAKVEENELLMMKIVDVGNKNASIEKEVLELHDKFKEAQEENEAKTQQIRELASNQEKILQKMEEQRVAEVREIQSQMKHAKDDMDSAKVLLKARIEEVASLQKNLKLLKLDDKSYEAIVDVSQTKAELTQAVSENTLLVEKLEVEKTAQAQLTERMNEQDAKMCQMKEQLNEAEQNALQSTSRLEVLTNYFNQKEADLLKELSTKEALWLSQQGEAMSTVDKIQSLQQEIQQYKQMSESVKRELAEQEASWRARVAALEKKSHEQWLARRAAERTSQAMEKEAQSLRQRLSGPSPNDKRVVSPLNVMDGVPDVGMMLPPGMGPMPPMPLPLPLPMPMGFLPPSAMMLPPPLPHLPPLPPHRPPPLGRLSSPPPNNNRYSPDSRYSPDRYSPDTRRSTPQHNRMRSPFSPTEARRRGYNHNGRYEDDRYYDSGDDRRLRRYDETETDLSPPPSPPPSRRLPPPQRHNNHNHKGISSGSGQSS